ncbi:MAG: PIN domain-containing protein [Oscillibacter sp.]|nr:PIN domain-containing protein [Oscillibacter sp.]
MRLLIDANVILDYLLSRQGFSEQAKQVIELARYSVDFEFVSSSAVTDIFYHANRELKNSFEAQDRISELIQFVSVLNVTEQDIRTALDMRWKDFEDAVQYAVALANHVDAVITRNAKDFERTEIPVLTPAEFLDAL